MKFLLLASFVLFCTASTVYRGSKNIAVNDDGTVLITSQYGKRVVINREILPTGEKNIDITISGFGFPTKTVQIRDTFYNNQIGSQGDVLTQILREYQGVVDEAQYEKLLYKINQAVTRGQISAQVYELFESLDQQTQGVQFGQGQVQGQQQAYGLNGVYGYNQYQQYTPQTQYQQLYSNQVPFVRSYGRFPYALGSKYYASSRYVNPLLEKIFGTTQGTYITDLLANQQLNGGVYGNVPQTYFSRIFGKTYVPLNQYYQQGFYGQRQTVPQVYGVQQTLAQYNEIPQTVQQQQIEQAVQQYSVGQQQQRVQQAVQQLEQLVESQQQEQLVEQLQQQQQQQQQQQFVEQRQQQQQQQQQQQYNNVPLSLQQLVGAMQTVGQLGGVNSYYYRQPYTGYVARQPYYVQGSFYNTVPRTYFNTVPQVQTVY